MLRQLAKQLGKSLELKIVATRSIATSTIQRKEAGVAEVAAEKTIIVEKDKNITLIGINRPKHRNAIDSNTARKLCEAFSAFEADECSPVAVLYGVGGSFCSGFDILEMDADGDQISIDILMTHEGSVGPTRRHIHKPVVCGINGYCVAGGLELALMCDLRVMEETAVLGFFNRRFGVPVIDGGTARLPAMVGFSRAMDLILTGRQLCATEAHQIGIANRIVPPGTSLHKSLELARTLAKFPQSALLHDRNSLYSNFYESSSFNQSSQNEIMYTSKDIIDQMTQGIKWFNKTFTSDTTDSWLKRERSMADWDDNVVAEAAAKEEEHKLEAKKKTEEELKLKKEAEKAQPKTGA